MSPIEHGGMLHEELAAFGWEADEVLDASVNVNPYGPCPVVADAIGRARIERYPDPTAAPARAAIARWLDVSVDRVVVGNGAVDLLWSLARCVVQPGDRVLVVEPAFSELRKAATRVGADIVEHRLQPEHGFALDFTELGARLRETRARLAYIATPGNPTGASVPIDALGRLAAEHPDTTLVVDLSFSSLSTRHREFAAHVSDRIVWLRSFTKDLALAGLRVGFGVMPRALAQSIEASRPPWSVNALAQAAAIAAVTPEAREFVVQSRDRLIADRARLEAGLQRLGLRPLASDTVYTLVSVDRPATELRRAMLSRHAVLVRDCASFGLPRHLRLCAQPPRALPRLLRALEEELGSP